MNKEFEDMIRVAKGNLEEAVEPIKAKFPGMFNKEDFNGYEMGELSGIPMINVPPTRKSSDLMGRVLNEAKALNFRDDGKLVPRQNGRSLEEAEKSIKEMYSYSGEGRSVLDRKITDKEVDIIKLAKQVMEEEGHGGFKLSMGHNIYGMDWGAKEDETIVTKFVTLGDKMYLVDTKEIKL